MITVCSLQQGSSFMTAQQVVDWLQAAFPNWEWTASVDGGVLYIRNDTLSTRWGMQRSMARVDKAWVLKAGGELLERFGMPYARPAVVDKPRDFTGDYVSEKWTPDRRFYVKNEQRWKA